MNVRPAQLAPCGIRHIPLDAPLQVLTCKDGENGLYLLVWDEGRPVGWRILVASELPVPTPALSVLIATAAARHLATPAPVTVQTPAERPTVSVVVCTRDRPDALRRCLASLAACHPPPDEIIVVDNAPVTDATAAIVAGTLGVRYLQEPCPGLSHARNAGACAASSEIVAYTDDDVEVRSDWIHRLAMPFADPAVACVTGSVIPADLGSEAACLFEFEIGSFGRELSPRRFDASFLHRSWWKSPDVWTIGAGANMAIRRAAFGRIGLFDTRLGAGASGCSEDSEIWFRMLRAGLSCQYDPGVVVFHHHRSDRQGLYRQLRDYARGHIVALFVQFGQDRRPCHLVRAFAVMPWYYMKLALRAWRQGDRDRLALVAQQIMGCAAGPIHALRLLRGDRPPLLTM